MDKTKLVVISAPSGTGKSTLINHLLENSQRLEFSVSITSRKARGAEEHGKEYYFVTAEEFRQKINNDELVEFVEVYKDNFYGTLKSEVSRITQSSKAVIFDIDVIGALKIKEQYGDKAYTIFIEPPSIKVLEERLKARGTDTEEVIATRIQRAEYELEFADKFDVVIVNNVLEDAKIQLLEVVNNFLDQ